MKVSRPHTFRDLHKQMTENLHTHTSAQVRGFQRVSLDPSQIGGKILDHS